MENGANDVLPGSSNLCPKKPKKFF